LFSFFTNSCRILLVVSLPIFICRITDNLWMLEWRHFTLFFQSSTCIAIKHLRLCASNHEIFMAEPRDKFCITYKKFTPSFFDEENWRHFIKSLLINWVYRVGCVFVGIEFIIMRALRSHNYIIRKWFVYFVCFLSFSTLFLRFDCLHIFRLNHSCSFTLVL
jgi:hypothetical protein